MLEVIIKIDVCIIVQFLIEIESFYFTPFDIQYKCMSTSMWWCVCKSHNDLEGMPWLWSCSFVNLQMHIHIAKKIQFSFEFFDFFENMDVLDVNTIKCQIRTVNTMKIGKKVEGGLTRTLKGAFFLYHCAKY